MREVLKTTDPVLLSFVEALLKDAGCAPFIADRYISAVEGSVGVLPCRVLVADDAYAHAREVLVDCDLGQWLAPDKP